MHPPTVVAASPGLDSPYPFDVPDLVLLNGPPASGKSTIASLLVAARPIALNLDVDLVRGALGGWLESPHESGLAARRLALAMCTAHLTAGHDVVVPQLVARETFVLQLAAVAAQVGARFVEVALMIDSEEMLRAFTARSAAPENRRHLDAAELVRQSGGTESLVELHDRLMAFLDTRSTVRRVQVVRGDVESTLVRVESALTTN